MPPQKRAASPAKAMPTKAKASYAQAKASYAQILAEIERTSVPKPGARPPTDVGTCQEGREFLQENAQKANVISLPCGMQYRVIKGSKQKDAPSPKIDTQCDVHYRGCLIDGTEFDTSKKPQNKGKPANFAPNKVIQGWTIAMQLMGEGDKWQLYVPSELAYGDAGRGKFIGPGAVLIFEMELLKVHGASKPKPQRPAEALTSMPAAAPAAAAAAPAAAAASVAAAVDVTDDGEAQPQQEEEEEESQHKTKRPKPTAAPLGGASASAAAPTTPAAPTPAESENAPPNVPAVEPAPKAVEATSADLEVATNRAFDEGVDTTLEAMSSMLNKLQVPTLQQALSDLGLPTTGRKEELSERLTGALSGA